MMRSHAVCLLVVLSLAAGTLHAQPASTLAQRTAGLDRADGFLPIYWDPARGRILFEITRLDEDILYYVSTAQGAGSVELGLDRGVTGTAVIRFERMGPRVHVVEQNLDFRAPNGSPALVENVRDSFATSVLASLPIEAEEPGRLLVDATPLVIRDAADIAGRLRRQDQGTFRLDPERSAVYPARTKTFPRNTEVEVTLTFAGDAPGSLVNGVTPDGRAFTLRQHHSFLQAPEAYRPRAADPRIGVSDIEYKDYSAPFNQDPEVRWVTRWRLAKRDPSAPVSEPVEPIVYYLDPAIPEPFRSAMREGVLWWNTAFEAAGFRNAIQVRDPEPDMDPMDIRYAFILWVNRDERGFSSGGGYNDPRTGEILGSTTRMDSARIRTISHYWQGYLPTNDDCGLLLPGYEFLLSGGQSAALRAPSEEELVVTRQKLLMAHELGHTLGLAHNWNASINGRASVMEYPTPRVNVTPDGFLDLGEAYPAGVGAYDVLAIRYAYTDFPPDREREGLDAIILEMRAKGLLFTPSTDPRWAWYDDLATPTEYLRETLQARRIMLDQYGPAVLRAGEPVGALRDMRFWMVYLHHRWAIDAAVRYIGGLYQNIVVKGESLPPTEIVPAALQRELLDLLMETIRPENLAIPEELLAALTPSPYGTDTEDLIGAAEFDHLRAARILSAMSIVQLLEPERAARLIMLADRQAGALTLPQVIESILDHTFGAARDAEPRDRSLRRVTQQVALDAMMMLGADADVTPEVRAVVLDALVGLRDELAQRQDPDPVTGAHIRQAQRDIDRYLENPREAAPESAAPTWGGRPRSRYPIPPGPPL